MKTIELFVDIFEGQTFESTRHSLFATTTPGKLVKGFRRFAVRASFPDNLFADTGEPTHNVETEEVKP